MPEPLGLLKGEPSRMVYLLSATDDLRYNIIHQLATLPSIINSALSVTSLDPQLNVMHYWQCLKHVTHSRLSLPHRQPYMYVLC